MEKSICCNTAQRWLHAGSQSKRTGCAEVVPDDAKNTVYFSMNTLKAAAGSRFVNSVMDDGVGGERGWRNRSFNRVLGGEEAAY